MLGLAWALVSLTVLTLRSSLANVRMRRANAWVFPQKAGMRIRCVLPFRDNVDTLAGYGVKAIIQPGGSIRDEEVIEACDEHGIAWCSPVIATSATR